MLLFYFVKSEGADLAKNDGENKVNKCLLIVAGKLSVNIYRIMFIYLKF